MNKLKYLILILALFVVQWNNSYGQCAKKGITTDPNGPVNPEFPNYTNIFNWEDEIFDVNSSYIGANTISSPFFQNNNNRLTRFHNNPEHRLASNGWELIKYNMGFRRDGSLAENDFLYIVLYNKYKSTLRVFVAGDQFGYNGAAITASFGSEGTGYFTSALSNASSVFALDEFERSSQGNGSPDITTVAEYFATGAKWFYGDFFITYDPCTCFYKSMMNIDVKLINTSTITFSGAIEGSLTKMEDDELNVESNGTSFSFDKLITTGTKAFESYQSIDKFKQKQKSKLDGLWGAEVDNYTEEQKKQANALKFIPKLFAKSELLKTGLKSAPYIGAAFQFVDLFTGGGNEATGGPVEIMPMSLDATVTLNGELNTEQPILPLTFRTPGAKIESGYAPDFNYPLYNEVMGVFNLLEKPQLNFDWELIPYPGGYASIIKGAQLDVEKGIKYVVNPAAGINWEESEIFASFVFNKRSGNETVSTPLMPIGHIQNMNIKLNDIITPMNSNGEIDWHNGSKLRIVLNLQRENAGPETQNVLMQMAFPIAINYTGSTQDNLTDFEFDGTAIRNRVLRADENPLRSWGKVIIGQDVTLARGVEHFQIIAYDGFEIEEGVTLPNNIELIEGSPTNLPTVVAPVSSAEVSAFCYSSLYTEPRKVARVGVGNGGGQVDEISRNLLLNAYPNPFNETTTIPYFIAEEGQMVKLSVTDMLGREVAVLVQEESHQKGKFEVPFHAAQLSSGIYLYTLEINGKRESKRLVITE